MEGSRDHRALLETAKVHFLAAVDSHGMSPLTRQQLSAAQLRALMDSDPFVSRAVRGRVFTE